MTAAVFAQTDWSVPRLNGSSVFFNQSVRGSECAAPIRRDSITAVAPDFWLSTGVTGSAGVVQQMTNDLIANLQEWRFLQRGLRSSEKLLFCCLQTGNEL